MKALLQKNLKRERLLITVLYVLLLAGGLWHALGIFQTAMRILATPMIAGICLLLCYEYLKTQPEKLRVNEAVQSGQAERAAERRKFLQWSGAVLLCGFLLEVAGVKSGVIFGNYAYGDTLQPQLWNVPVAIGCAWLSMLLSSAALAQKVWPDARPLAQSVVIALFMVLFDAFMEPAAMKLGYWHWSSAKIPVRNFVAWLVFGLILSHWGARWRIFTRRVSTVPVHAYFAQIGYFIIVNLS